MTTPEGEKRKGSPSAIKIHFSCLAPLKMFAVGISGVTGLLDGETNSGSVGCGDPLAISLLASSSISGASTVTKAGWLPCTDWDEPRDEFQDECECPEGLDISRGLSIRALESDPEFASIDEVRELG